MIKKLRSEDHLHVGDVTVEAGNVFLSLGASKDTIEKNQADSVLLTRKVGVVGGLIGRQGFCFCLCNFVLDVSYFRTVRYFFCKAFHFFKLSFQLLFVSHSVHVLSLYLSVSRDR